MLNKAMDHLPNAGIAKFLAVITIIGTPLVLCPESEKRSCSFSLNTALTRDHCPSSQTDWREREKVFNCSSYQQNCTTSNLFSYHCVPNAWQNACIEVCAIETPIVGKKCAEFNFGGKMVQEYNKGKCKSCPFLYISTEAYKYMECFAFENVASTITDVINNSGPQYSTTTTIYKIKPTCSGFECIWPAVGCSVAVLLGIFMVTTLIFVVRKRCTSRLRQNASDPELPGYNKKTSEETIPLNLERENIGEIPNSMLVGDALHTGFFSPHGKTPAIPDKQETTIGPEDEPEYKAYENYETRLRSFSGFSLQNMKKGLAYAGFYYEGYALATKCFQCGCSKEDWEIGDDAMMEHSNLNASCPYMRYIGKNNDLPLQFSVQQ